MTDTLELMGEPLFAGGLLLTHLEDQVRRQVVREYAALAPGNRKFSRLQLRRRFSRARFPPPVSIAPAAGMSIIATVVADGRLAARHSSLISGDPSWLHYAPGGATSGFKPVATVEGDRLMITVLFHEEDRPFVSPLVRSELDLIEVALGVQRDLMERAEASVADIVRRVVDEEWPRVSAGGKR